MKEMMQFRNDWEVSRIAHNETERFKTASKEVLRSIQDGMTIGAISREFKQHQDILMDLLYDLRSDGHIDFDDHRPAPTRVYLAEREVKSFALPIWEHSHLFNKPKRRSNTFEYI